ncbi:GNAT family N-acetyltransferase [Paraburkholderia tagetis]|uniref:Acetyltransferase n=1 Tax=Paraburkholderia tagetis TaxID=2913261 RepID=A0A9X1UHW9_9BURK|nr:acetyltransferase [Paraburkholderia tagetis]
MRTEIVAEEIALHHAPPRAASCASTITRARDETRAASPHGFQIRPLEPERDAPALHRWFVEERAAFWNMRDKSVDEVAAFYRAIEDSGHAQAWLGLRHGTPAFLFESYDPAHDEAGEHYTVRAGDLGMHLFVGPTATPVPGYTRHVFRTLMAFLFERLNAERIVVEPDARNTRIHALNRAMGFVYDKDVPFREKTASLAFCTRADFYAAIQQDF